MLLAPRCRTTSWLPRNACMAVCRAATSRSTWRARSKKSWAAAVEEAQADFAFQRGELLADRRLGAQHLLGPARDAPLFGHGDKEFELTQVHERLQYRYLR